MKNNETVDLKKKIKTAIDQKRKFVNSEQKSCLIEKPNVERT